MHSVRAARTLCISLYIYDILLSISVSAFKVISKIKVASFFPGQSVVTACYVLSKTELHLYVMLFCEAIALRESDNFSVRYSIHTPHFHVRWLPQKQNWSCFCSNLTYVDVRPRTSIALADDEYSLAVTIS